MTEVPRHQPVVFEIDRLVEYSDEAIIAELRRVANNEPDGPLTTRLFHRHSRVSYGTVTRRFGSWDKALTAAGLRDRWLGSRAAKLMETKRLTDEEILQALVGLANRLGKTELTWREVTAHLPFRGNTLKKRWGSVRAAFEVAGLSSTRRGHRYSDEECFDNLLTVWTYHGRSPRLREMREPPSKIGTAAYLERFGTWRKALSAFVWRVNSDWAISSPVTSMGDATLAIEQLPTAIEEVSRDKRVISLGLRYQVLHRDRFKCVLCGDSPSSNPICILHVDHIAPWAKGGRTNIANLRSLCSSCNVGRGDRYDD